MDSALSTSYRGALRDDGTANESTLSGVSWAAVIAGAFVTAALALILLSLGTGLELSAISPWANRGASASATGMAALLWLIATQSIASAMGGYLAGRLRTKWVGVHTDEVFFRDTAHGFLAWAVAAVISAALLASAATSLVGGIAEVGGASLATASAGVGASVTTDASKSDSGLATYVSDTLMRSDTPRTDGSEVAVRAETSRILANGLKQDNLSAADQQYLSKLIVARTSISSPDADKRVADGFAQLKQAQSEAKQAADAARKAAAHLSLWTFLSFLIGAFVASFAATVGGRQRDRIVNV